MVTQKEKISQALTEAQKANLKSKRQDNRHSKLLKKIRYTGVGLMFFGFMHDFIASLLQWNYQAGFGLRQWGIVLSGIILIMIGYERHEDK